MEQTLFTQFLLQFGKSSPLFLLIFLGFALSRWFGFNKTASTVLSKFAFNIALPAMLFRLLSNLALTESHADLRLLIAFFGACFILFFYRTICFWISFENEASRNCNFRYRMRFLQ